MNAPPGSSAPSAPAPASSEVTSAGTSTRAQCQKPLGVGASGSKQVTTYDFVPSGAPDHDSSGERFPSLEGPPREDICYATTNRQDAVKEVARRADVVLVIGSQNSSNSNRLAEVATELGTPGYLVDDETEVDPAWLEGAEVIGVTSGASAPEWLVDRMLAFLADRGVIEVEELRLAEENVRFSLPAGVRGIPLAPA